MSFGRWQTWRIPLNCQLGSGAVRIFLLFIPLYALLTLYARSRSAHDPGSVFFDPWTGYDASYSAIRMEEGDIYIEAADNTTGSDFQKASDKPQLCVGIATVAREGIRYLRSTVGTLLDGLSEEERKDIYLIIFIAHSDPSKHPAYDERWLAELPDQVLLYKEDEVDIDHVRALEKDKKTVGRQKALFDYQYLLKACNMIETPYILMLEDDVVAQDGWYHRTQEAILSAEKQTKQIGAPKCEPGTLMQTHDQKLTNLLCSNRALPTLILFGRIPWLEFRRMANLRLLLHPRRSPRYLLGP